MAGPQWYGSDDFHDVNRVNNKQSLPVLLDFDNFSGKEGTPDDIRRLSSWPNSTRSELVRTLWHILRLYSPNASLSIPLSKVAGGDWPAFKQPQSQCWSGAWGNRSRDGLYFGAVSCRIVNVTRELFLGPAHPTVAEILAAVKPHHFGTALQSADLSCIWAFRTLLDRDFVSASEYQYCVGTLPSLLLGARGARCELARRVLQSAEFNRSACADDPACIERRLHQFLCLGLKRCTEAAGPATSSAPGALCNAADRDALFGNAALIDPTWKL